MKTFSGIAFLQVGRKQFALRGDFAVSPNATKRVKIAGWRGYQELPRVPYVDGAISGMDCSPKALAKMQDATLVFQLANGRNYVLTNAVLRGAKPGPRGQAQVRFEGLRCTEVSFPPVPKKRRRRTKPKQRRRTSK